MFNSAKKEMEEIVLSYPKLKNRIEGKDEEVAKARALLKEIAADFSPRVAKSMVKMLDGASKYLYDGLNVENAGETPIDELVKNNSVVLVPNHQSHADYVALNYYIYKTFGFPVYVAGGINLNVMPIGPLFRSCGCFFIRRSFNSNILYRIVLEAYIFYLLKMKKPIEFFFEGGRSRSGKLLNPKFGMYQLVFDAHRAMPENERHPLKFVPVSIVHEYVPEQKTLSKELQGAKKKSESFMQVLKVFKMFSHDFGTIHMRLGKPIDPPYEIEDHKELTKHTAALVFQSVENNMMMTPPALLSMILLDAPSGALKWKEILNHADKIIKYCNTFKIPLSPNLRDEDLNTVLERAIDMLIANKKVVAIGRTRFGHVFYSIRPEVRLELLYFKNAIVHHFIEAWIVNLFWLNIFNGTLTNRDQVFNFFKNHSERLHMEFTLPEIDDLVRRAISIMEYFVGREISCLDDCIEFRPSDLYKLASGISVFARTGSFIMEGYLVAARAIRSFGRHGFSSFNYDQFSKEYFAVFKFDTEHAGIVKNRECLSKPLIKNTLKYFENTGVIKNEMGRYTLIDRPRIEKFIDELQVDLSTELMFNVSEN